MPLDDFLLMSDNRPSDSGSPASPNANAHQATASQEPSLSAQPTTVASSVASHSPVTSTPSEPLRQDLLQSAVSFLSSPNVQSADTAKKVAFLRQKGLTETEIQEAFKRAGQGLVPQQQQSTVSTAERTVATRPAIPPRPATLYASGPPQVRYYEPPRPPVMPFQQLIAMALVIGFGAVGSIAVVFKLIKSIIGPIFNRIAAYQRNRYSQRTLILKKISALLTHETNGESELATHAAALVEKQDALTASVARVVECTKDHVQEMKQEPYTSFRDKLSGLKDALTDPKYGYTPYSTYSYYPSARSAVESPLIQNIKSDIRSFKGMLLNRRNFPMVNTLRSASYTSSTSASVSSSTTASPARDVPDYHPRRQQTFRNELSPQSRSNESDTITSTPPAVAEAQ